MKRFFDICFSLIGLIIASPFLLIVSFFIWFEDKGSPFFMADRVGSRGKLFKMIKLRSMVLNANKSGVESTSASDKRITKTGKYIRKFKLDELSQLWNVFKGDMSFVGPRPNVVSETNLYTNIEKKLLKVKPGITDYASIVFSDEANILKDFTNPDLAYNQLIRPWKSRLGLFYVNNNNLLIDIILIFITLISLFSRKFSLKLLSKLLTALNAPKELIEISLRKFELHPFPPPGSDEIVTQR